jgi:hypothetical protein
VFVDSNEYINQWRYLLVWVEKTEVIQSNSISTDIRLLLMLLFCLITAYAQVTHSFAKSLWYKVVRISEMYQLPLRE